MSLRLSSIAYRTMSSTAAKDITKWASQDGEFKRQVSKFRQEVEVGGRFAPEKGGWWDPAKEGLGG